MRKLVLLAILALGLGTNGIELNAQSIDVIGGDLDVTSYDWRSLRNSVVAFNVKTYEIKRLGSLEELSKLESGTYRISYRENGRRHRKTIKL